MLKIINIVGARPNFMKIAPIMNAYKKYLEIQPLLIHTGQHYDEKMSDLFFRQLEIPEPDVNLEVGSASHAVMTAEIMKRFEPIVLEHKPDAVLVVGDVNSTIACGLVAVKLGVKLIHVEAGLRSFDANMPEEINRILTDRISDILFCTEKSGVDNLLKEGVDASKIHMVGNVMIDTLLHNISKSENSTILNDLDLEKDKYASLTLHRPSNVDNPETFSEILTALEKIQKELKIVFPIHPRTRKRLSEFGLLEKVNKMGNIILVDPLSYLDFLKLMANSKIILSDSGGIQEEAVILKTPCITLRENTERPITVDCGINQTVGTNPAKILEAFEKARNFELKEFVVPDKWDGQAATRIVDLICTHLDSR